MKSSRLSIRMVLAALIIAVFSGCMQRVEQPRAQMTVREARKSLTESLTEFYGVTSITYAKFNKYRLFFDSDGIYKNGIIYFWGIHELESGHSFDGYDEVSFKYKYDSKIYTQRLFFKNGANLSRAVDALLNLKAAALAPNTEEADFAAFSTAAKTWLATSPKPEISDDARAYKTLAEDAFRRKDISASLTAYEDALGKFQMWPEGHYNAALLAAEIEDFELAALHMRRYLVLAPNANDAEAAKEKYLLWQLKAKQEAEKAGLPKAQ
jgi:hypothetical protein